MRKIAQLICQSVAFFGFGLSAAMAFEPGNATATKGNCAIPSYATASSPVIYTAYDSDVLFSRNVTTTNCVYSGGSNVTCGTVTYTESWVFNTSNNTFNVQVPLYSGGMTGYPFSGTYSGTLAANEYGGFSANVTLSCGGTFKALTVFSGS